MWYYEFAFEFFVSLINCIELHKTFGMHSFYVCMRIMIMSCLKMYSLIGLSVNSAWTSFSYTSRGSYTSLKE